MCKCSLGRQNNITSHTWSLPAPWSPSLTALKEGQCLSSGSWFGLISSGRTVQCQCVSVQHHENMNIKNWSCDSPRGSHQCLCLLQLKVFIGHGLNFLLCSHLLEVCRRLQPGNKRWFALIAINPTCTNSKGTINNICVYFCRTLYLPQVKAYCWLQTVKALLFEWYSLV